MHVPHSSSSSLDNDHAVVGKDYEHVRDGSGNWNGWYDLERRSRKGFDQENDNKEEDLSPFPKSWSLSYSGASADGISRDVAESLLLDTVEDEYDFHGNDHEDGSSVVTDGSSVYSTISQALREKQAMQRDEHGNCRKHPHVKLAEKVPTSKKWGELRQNEMQLTEKFIKASRFPKFLSARSSNRKMTRENHTKNRSSNSNCNNSNNNSNNNNNSSPTAIQEEKWKIIQNSCPECEKEHVQKCKMQYHSPSKHKHKHKHNHKHYNHNPDFNPKQQLQQQPLTDPFEHEKQRHLPNLATKRSPVTYVPFPATLTIVETHAEVHDNNLPALCIRTDAVPLDQILHLSCVRWNSPSTPSSAPAVGGTPDGVLDFLIPCDENGKPLPSSKTSPQNQLSSTTEPPEYRIMERIIPLVSIDHVSRGGDAWDVLRQSTGENDCGCKCDVKIHGFSDRLLRMDVVSFDPNGRGFGFGDFGGGDSGGGTKGTLKMTTALRRTFVGVDLLRSSISGVMGRGPNGSGNSASNNHRGCVVTEKDSEKMLRSFESYTPENVIILLNNLVTWDRERRATGVESWSSYFTTFAEEYLGLGAPKAGKDSIPVTTTPKQRSKRQDERRHDDRFDIS